MSETPSIIDDPAAITAAWMTGMLRHAGHDATVASLESEPVGTGQMAHNERYRITYADGTGPATVVIKFPSPSEESRAAGAAGGYRKEVRFYTDLAEDLAPAQQGDQIAGATDDQAIVAATNLAGLHAPRWDDPTLHEIDWLASSGNEAAMYVQVFAPMFIDRYQHRMSADARRVIEAFAEGVGNWLERESPTPTLVHGDYRLDNLLFATPEGGRPVTTVDWQTLDLGAGGRDLAYLLGNSAEPADRRRHEAAAIDAYRAEMDRLGVALSEEDVLAQYRHGTFQGPFITMLGSIAVGQTDRGDDMFMAMLERSVAQIIDHDALDVIA